MPSANASSSSRVGRSSGNLGLHGHSSWSILDDMCFTRTTDVLIASRITVCDLPFEEDLPMLTSRSSTYLRTLESEMELGQVHELL